MTRQHLTERELTEKIVIDMQLPLCEVTESFIKELSLLEPFGKGNTKPVFAQRKLSLLRGRLLGKHQNVLKLEVMDEDHTIMEAVFFRRDGVVFFFLLSFRKNTAQTPESSFFPEEDRIFFMDVTYYPGVNNIWGKRHCRLPFGLSVIL